MYCANCGSQNADQANNCTACGAGLSGPADPRMGTYAASTGSPAPTYLVQSILVTIFCCQIFGIVAIVYSAVAMGRNSAGDYAGASEHAAKAKMWCWLGFGIGFVIVLGYAGLAILGAAAGAAGATP